MQTTEIHTSERKTDLRNSAIMQDLLDNLSCSFEIYRKVAVRSENDPISGTFFLRANQKQSQYYAIGKSFGIDLEQHTLSFKQGLNLQLSKLWIEMNNLLIRLKMKELLSICIKHEERLIVSIERVLNKMYDDAELIELLRKYRDESLQLLKALKSEEREYNFLEKA